MTLPVSGAISFNNINVELGVSGTTQASLGQSSYRTLAGVASGAISMSNFYGKANQFAFTISSNQTNANLRTLAVNAGWNQSTKVVATIGSGVYISSDSTGTPALTISGSFPGGVELINNGYIVGRGGNGGEGGGSYAGNYGTNVFAGSGGTSGGLALSVSSGITITNNGTIGGGGGGGGGGGAAGGQWGKNCWVSSGGGGGGGGRSSVAANSSGGAGGYGQVGGQGSQSGQYGSGGGSGTYASNGSGGSGGYTSVCSSYFCASGGSGGAGGTWGSSGSNGNSSSSCGYGVVATRSGGSGGSAGGAVSGNGYITWAATGTRLGSIS
jgi:hypothetical protein